MTERPNIRRLQVPERREKIEPASEIDALISEEDREGMRERYLTMRRQWGEAVSNNTLKTAVALRYMDSDFAPEFTDEDKRSMNITIKEYLQRGEISEYAEKLLWIKLLDPKALYDGLDGNSLTSRESKLVVNAIPKYVASGQVAPALHSALVLKLYFSAWGPVDRLSGAEWKSLISSIRELKRGRNSWLEFRHVMAMLRLMDPARVPPIDKKLWTGKPLQSELNRKREQFYGGFANALFETKILTAEEVRIVNKNEIEFKVPSQEAPIEPRVVPLPETSQL